MVLYKMKKSVKAINVSGLGEYAFFPRGFFVHILVLAVTEALIEIPINE